MSWPTDASPRPLRRGRLTRHTRAWPGLWLLLTLGAGIAEAAPAPIQTQFPDTEVLAELPAVTIDTRTVDTTPDALAQRLREDIAQARKTGDPRFIGYGEGRLRRWPEDRMTPELRVLRATLAQSQHRFDVAETDLRWVVDHGDGPNRAQALLTLASILTVQGRYDGARAACDDLSNAYPGLISDSCLATVDARTGNAQTAFDRLNEALRSAPSDRTSRLWALGTLADLADQLDDTRAGLYWQQVLLQDPDDLYTRTQLADWSLRHGQPKRTLALTADYPAVDALAVLRAMALKSLGDPALSPLVAHLRERFSEARWRGNLLHKRDYARFELHVEGNPALALEFAEKNWSTQREPADTRLLLLAARAANAPEPEADLRQWLDRWQQSDQRYPPADPSAALSGTRPTLAQETLRP